MTNEQIAKINEQVQIILNKLPFSKMVELTASELHEIWKQTTYIRNKNGEVTGQVEKWKKLNPAYGPAERKYINKILSDERFFKFPFIRKEEDGSISIDISKMQYNQLSPHWQEENKEAATAAVEATLENLIYLSNPNQRELIIHSVANTIHMQWRERRKRELEKEKEQRIREKAKKENKTIEEVEDEEYDEHEEERIENELFQRYSNLSHEEKMKDVRHIYIAEKSIDIFLKKMGLDKIIEEIKIKNTVSR